MPSTPRRPSGAIITCGIVVLVLTACNVVPPGTDQATTTKEATRAASSTLRPMTVTPTDSSIPSVIPSDSRMPIIWDDDGSPDGVIALLYFLSHPQFDVKAITVSCGEAHPNIFAANLEAMLARVGHAGIPIGAGRETPLAGSNTFPEPWRIPTDNFWGIRLPDLDGPAQVLSAARLIFDTANASPQPITIFASGNLTNLAEALRFDPGIKDNIASVQIMGGAVYVAGNLDEGAPELGNQAAEWNIWIDPIAAHEIFVSGLPMTITPLDATNQITWSREEARAWSQPGRVEGVLADEIMQWSLNAMRLQEIYVWDLVAAANILNPDLCRYSDLHIDVVTQQGPTEGATVVDSSAPPNALVCLAPNSGAIKQDVLQVFTTNEAIE